MRTTEFLKSTRAHNLPPKGLQGILSSKVDTFSFHLRRRPAFHASADHHVRAGGLQNLENTRLREGSEIHLLQRHAIDDSGDMATAPDGTDFLPPARSDPFRGRERHMGDEGRLQNLVPKGQHIARTVQYFVHELQHLASTVQFLAAPAAFDILTNRKWQS